MCVRAMYLLLHTIIEYIYGIAIITTNNYLASEFSIQRIHTHVWSAWRIAICRLSHAHSGRVKCCGRADNFWHIHDYV